MRRGGWAGKSNELPSGKRKKPRQGDGDKKYAGNLSQTRKETTKGKVFETHTGKTRTKKPDGMVMVKTVEEKRTLGPG